MLNIGSDFSGVGALDQALLAMEIPYQITTKPRFLNFYKRISSNKTVIIIGK